jgi:hypothetical protein
VDRDEPYVGVPLRGGVLLSAIKGAEDPGDLTSVREKVEVERGIGLGSEESDVVWCFVTCGDAMPHLVTTVRCAVRSLTT